jgi:hypothetical protein
MAGSGTNGSKYNCITITNHCDKPIVFEINENKRTIMPKEYYTIFTDMVDRIHWEKPKA